MNNYHIPVLLQEVLHYLNIKPGELYVDCTLGGGGHALSIVRSGGKVLALDVDTDAILYVRKLIEKEKIHDGEEITIVQDNFSNVKKIAKEKGFFPVSGVLMDIGVSSYQLGESKRGFSFVDGPLDMRMDQSLSVQAKDLVNGLTEKELTFLFEKLGEERFAKKIAKVIVERRKDHQIESTGELAELVKESVFRSDHDIHPATRIFQALRIAVNDELHILEDSLPQAVSLLKPHGRLVVISFHSLEDRIVKRAFEQFEKEGKGKVITKKPIQASEKEVLSNRRARSAKLRVFEKKE
ncbi:MAG: 16S rRNA (cytosine(1402)-N(4))-methyltransferase RsmH [Candidatus Levybacteria bacterium]|nr:16S rRNA (cytosine(1402)-N(4))-methyltransferase RsmH [Candidatus Levybacteria bacterium]